MINGRNLQLVRFEEEKEVARLWCLACANYRLRGFYDHDEVISLSHYN